MNYSAKLLHYFDHTKHAGSLGSAADVFTIRKGVSDNRDVIEISLQCHSESISKACFLAYGSPALIAAGEWVCQWLEGKDKSDVATLNYKCVLAALDLTELHIHIAQLVCSAVHACMEISLIERSIDNERTVS